MTNDSNLPQPQPLRLQRHLHARRELVFQAWSSVEHIRNWFAPEGLTVAEAVVEFRPGGKFEVCMRMPDGTDHWARGNFVEIAPPQRLVIDMYGAGPSGESAFRAYTEVDFVEVVGGTRLDIVQTYTFIDAAAAAPMIAGASEGWRTTLDRLEREVARIQAGPVDAQHSAVHAIFHLERTYDAPAALVWRALSVLEDKQRWFGAPLDGMTRLEHSMDLRPGGRERAKARWGAGMVSCFDAVYHDVIPCERLVYSYEMHLDDRKISVSLATMQLREAAGRTTLKVTEQGVFLDGYDDAGAREHGTGFLLDKLGEALRDLRA
jgi:uncharacterized protein YndB with AHSA1/START domain